MAKERKQSPAITEEMAAHIRYLVDVRRLYQHQVAALLETNQGRISEVMTGKTFPKAPPAQGAFPF
ncbi:hypothetical protein [Novosphingopyxis sp.]|uniref:hypothetical protein n=1 Tax=Novosphingopyxis sp. TaxID=2709690 RepID=UPI003B59825C